MIVKLLTEHHLGFLSLKGGCRGSSESTLVKLPLCWKSHALAQFILTCATKGVTIAPILAIPLQEPRPMARIDVG